LTVLPPYLADRPRSKANNPACSFISLANHLATGSWSSVTPFSGAFGQ
jgi:hypothetical protein